MVGIRFCETIKAYVKKFGDASRLTAIPLGIAGWLRYMLGVDDEGNKFELASYFKLSFTGDIYLYMLILSTDRVESLAYKYKTDRKSVV